MDFKANRNKQLAAAVTLAVMGTAWAVMPNQVWAGSFGTEDTPLQYQKYVEDLDGAIASAESAGTGDAAYATQHHQLFGVSGDMQGKTLTINSMTVIGITGASGVGSNHGAAADTAINGTNGGLSWAAGLSSSNLSNAAINFGSDVVISAEGGDGLDDKAAGQNGDSATIAAGHGAAGGDGGAATATGIKISAGGGNVISGGKLTITAEGMDGVDGGVGGTGGTLLKPADSTATGTTGDTGDKGPDGNESGSDGVNAGNGTPGKDGGSGGPGTSGSTGGAGGVGANGGNGGNATAMGLSFADGTVINTVTLAELDVIAAAGTGGIGGNGGDGGTGSAGSAGANGGVGGKGGQGGNGTSPGDGDGGNGGAGGAGGVGGTGGNGGNGGSAGAGGNGGNGGDATALAMSANNSKLVVSIDKVMVRAIGGDAGMAGISGAGGAGGAGGNGGTGGNGGNGGTGGNGDPMGTDGIGGNGGSSGTGGTGGTGGLAAANGLNGAAGIAMAQGFGLVNADVTLKTETIVVSAKAGLGQGSFAAADNYAGTDNIQGNGGSNTGTAGTSNTGTTVITGKNGGAGGSGVGTGGAGGNGYTPSGTIDQTANGATATAVGLDSSGGSLNVISDADLAISVTAADASVTNTALGLQAENTAVALQSTGILALEVTATGDETAGTYDAGKTNTTALATAVTVEGKTFSAQAAGITMLTTATKGEVKDEALSLTSKETDVQMLATNAEIGITLMALAGDDASAVANAAGITAAGGSITMASQGTLMVTAAAISKDDGVSTAAVIDSDGAKMTLYSAKEMTISADSGNDNSDSYAIGIKAKNNSELTFQTQDAAITVSGGDTDNDYAAEVESGTTTFDAGTAKVSLEGGAMFTNGVLNFKSDTDVTDNGDATGMLDITGTTMNLTDKLQTLTVAAITTMDGSTVYFYDDKNLEDRYNAALSTDYRTISTDKLEVSGDDSKLFMRTNANGVYGGTATQGDKITAGAGGSGSGKLTLAVFDQGMRNGYENKADAATGNHLQNEMVLVSNVGDDVTVDTTVMSYDNGVWAYDYDLTAEHDKDNNEIILTSVKTKSAKASVAQWAAQDANKIAAGAAVTLFGADETLMERLGDVRSGDDNDGIWAKYVGGKIKVDGLQGDNDFKYNGFAAGYDHEIGNNWRIGLAGQYAKGDTTLINGDGEIKTAAGALYGTWTGDKGHHVDIIAKVGKVDSESTVYGGTKGHKLDGDFSSNAMSFAVEYGYRKALQNDWFIEPMVRASYVHLSGDDYTVVAGDDTAMGVTNDSMNSIILRGGFLLGKEFKQGSSVYLKAAVLHDFDGDINTSIKGDGRSAGYSDSIGGTAIEYGIGVNHKFNKDSSMYLDVERISGGDVTKNWGVNVGFRYSF